MPVPIVCLDARVRQGAACFTRCFSKPQYQHFVTVLRGLLLCQEARTLSGLRRQVAGGASVASLSRFLARPPGMRPPWRAWRARCDTHVAPLVQAERDHQRRTRPRQVGRPKDPLVIGYLIGDDSTLAKPKGTTMEGVGYPYSSTADGRARARAFPGPGALCTPWSALPARAAALSAKERRRGAGNPLPQQDRPDGGAHPHL